MTNTITITVREINGTLLLDSVGLGLMCGVHPEAVPSRDGFAYLDDELSKCATRWAKEAAAHTGSNTLRAGLTYWAATDHGAEVEFVYQEAQ